VKISVRALTKDYPAASGVFHALGPVNLEVREGEFVCIVGPSGCGKTTLLRILSGLEEPSAGDFRVVQADTSRPSNALVFQGHWLFPWLTVSDNIQYGMRVRGLARAERERTTRRLLSTIGLARFGEVYPHQLPDGMRQRVSLARALANDPEILLMDEPFGALDEQTRLLLQQELLRIWEQSQNTVLFVTHSLDEAIVLGDRVLVMSASPGGIIGEETVPFARPRNVIALKTDVRFGEMLGRLWNALGDEVMKAKAHELGL